MDFTIVVPFYNGHQWISRLINTLPKHLPIIVVDDVSETPFQSNDPRIKTIRLEKKGWFAGACSTGWNACETDVLILNQDIWFEGDAWLNDLAELSRTYALIGDGVMNHPAWPKGYVQGTFMFARRDAINATGDMNATDYPLWGATAEWQLRMCRKGFQAKPIGDLDWFRHRDNIERKYGSAITEVVESNPQLKPWFIRTPPAVSVVIPCYNYAHFLPNAVNSLIGGNTDLGPWPGQSFQSFEIIIVDDASPDNTQEVGQALANPWQGIRYIRLPKNKGTAGANNEGIKNAFGRFITILSADDMREPDSLEKLYRVVEKEPKVVAYDDLMTFSNGQRRQPLKLKDYDFEILLEKNHMHAGILFAKEAWKKTGGYPEQMVYGREDWAFNVRLGLAGYCGKRLNNHGYLYRREGKNRTERNKGQRWRSVFLEQLQALFPELYRGIRPMGCCGNGRARTVSKPSTNNFSGSYQIMSQDGMTLVEYQGGNYGTEPFYGAVTKQAYAFGKSKPRGYVFNADLVTNNFKKPGLLELAEGGKNLFVVVTPEAQPKVSIQEAETVNPTTATVSTSPQPTPPFSTIDEIMEDEHTHLVVVDEDIPVEIEAPDPTDMTVAEIQSLLESGDLTTAQIEQMLETEKANKNRKTAITAFEEALGG